jgi:hypothetical protein
MPNLEWINLAIGLISAVFGGGAGLIAGVWRVSHIEQSIRGEFHNLVETSKEELEEKVETLVGQFRETFQALRQKIGDVELNTERLFVSKDGFNDFRREYREDMQSLMQKIDHISMRADQK